MMHYALQHRYYICHSARFPPTCGATPFDLGRMFMLDRLGNRARAFSGLPTISVDKGLAWKQAVVPKMPARPLAIDPAAHMYDGENSMLHIMAPIAKPSGQNLENLKVTLAPILPLSDSLVPCPVCLCVGNSPIDGLSPVFGVIFGIWPHWRPI